MITLAEIKDKDSISLLKKYAENKNKLLQKAARQAIYILTDNIEDDIECYGWVEANN